MGDYAVYAAFLSSSSELLEDSILNKLAAKTAPSTAEHSKLGPKVHVELLFVPSGRAPVQTIKLGHAVYEDTSVQRMSRFAAVDGVSNAIDVAGGDLKGVACSIHYGGEAFVHENKTFSRTNWEFRRIPATSEQANKALEWFRQRQGDGFNKLGFFSEPARRAANKYVSCVPNPFSPSSFLQGKRPRWFCSELCEAGLRHAGILTNLTQSPHPEQFFQEIKSVSTVAAPVEGRGGGMTF